MMNERQQKRKDEHLHLAEQLYHESHALSGVRFIHQSLPEISLDEVSLHTSFGVLSFDCPFFINAMTGGSHHSQQINKRLAKIAAQTHLAIASGSLSAAIKNEALIPTFSTLRQHHSGIVIANIGAEHSVQNAQKAIDVLQADALQIHINTTQELIMPEGGRSFHWLNNIQKIVQHCSCPVIVKEVGFGMSRETLVQLQSIGVQYVDISGRGGTNFAAIENKRQSQPFMELNDWGLSTAESLLDNQSMQSVMHLCASGGIQSPLDVAKCLSLGAEIVGISGYFLHYLLHHTDEETINEIKRWQQELKLIMTLVGARSPQELTQAPLLLDTSLSHWCQARDIDWRSFAQRRL